MPHPSAPSPARGTPKTGDDSAQAGERDPADQQKGRGYLHCPPAVRYRFIQEQEGRFSVSALCRAVRVSRSGYSAWKQRPPSRRSHQEQELLVRIRAAHQESRGTYGSPRIAEELRGRGVVCSRNRVARVMQKYEITAHPCAGLWPRPIPGTRCRSHPYDNAPVESFFATLKRELIPRCSFATREEVHSAVFEWIAVWYNRKRRHSTLVATRSRTNDCRTAPQRLIRPAVPSAVS